MPVLAKEILYCILVEAVNLVTVFIMIYLNSTLTNEWREIINSSPDNGPMRKRSCGMISFNMNGEDNLLVIGGLGPTPITTNTDSKYIPSPNIPNHCLTNEIHTMCLSSSPGVT